MSLEITWWDALRHDGMVIAPAQLDEHFSAPPAPLPGWLVDRLRGAVSRVLDGGGKDEVGALVDLVLERLLGLASHQWLKGSNLSAAWTQKGVTGVAIRPTRVWQDAAGGELVVFVTEDARLRIGRGKLTYARMVEWLRLAGRSYGVLTNGHQWWLVHAGAEHDASCQWDIGLWFLDGAPSPQVDALRRLLGAPALQPQDKKPNPLAAAITASRASQGELSTALGERVRKAVEDLIHGASPHLRALPEGVAERHLYVAATRIIMRLVVVLFAEARDLLPVANPIYDGSYSLGGLLTELDRRAGGRAKERLRHLHLAWPRVRALFQLVYQGSTHNSLPVPRYGGGLFTPGALDARDPVDRAVALLEAATPSDSVVYAILEKLTRTTVRIRKGRGATTVATAVNFRTLSSEYIGILYEGLLDYELRRADQIIVFLNAGNQQFAIPFRDLDEMTEPAIRSLLAALKKDTKGDDEEDGDRDDTPEETEGGEAEEPPDEGDTQDQRDDAYQREAVRTWARKAVFAAGIVRENRKKDRAVLDREVEGAIQALISRTVLPGDWYLVRWGGTRKGAGTFYTRPQLASPTVRRTLDPLLFEGEGEARRARAPEEILGLKICDPAMGSASFLVSALRQLTDALYRSLIQHGRILGGPERTVVRLADGLPLDHPAQETLPVPPDHEDFEERVKARLRRHVVERCLYGVDQDPLAVDLGRLALWVETMDRSLPFSFLDHKLKGGNALIGAWLDRFADYPLRAWDRDGGDTDHDRFVHHMHEITVERGAKRGQVQRRGDRWSFRLKALRDEARTQLADLLDRRLLPSVFDAAPAMEELREHLARLHELPVHDSEEHARRYREEFLETGAYKAVKARMDLWCALWFWPGDALDLAPLPRSFAEPSPEAMAEGQRIAGRWRFFHWELEFPDVYAPGRGGFDAVIGNPPWETAKPNSKEFFSDVDPLYRTYGKQDAVVKQRGYFQRDADVEERWLGYVAGFKALGNWSEYAARPFGDPEEDPGGGVRLRRGQEANDELHTRWRELRAGRIGYADPEHPFQHQGSADLNTYKMFLELGHALLKGDGRLGIIVPSGIYSDLGSRALRTLFLERCRWDGLYVLQNEKFVFANVHHSFKLCVLSVVKGGETESIHTRFRLGPGDSPTSEELETDILALGPYLPLPVDRVRKFSPDSLSVLEIRSELDLAVVDRMYNAGVSFSQQDDGWDLEYMREFHSADDSGLWKGRAWWEQRGYRPDLYGHWIKGDWRVEARADTGVSAADGAWISVQEVLDVAVPLYQGVMIGSMTAAAAVYESGGGNRTVWRALDDAANHRLQPQFLIGLQTLRGPGSRWLPQRKVLVRDISSTTNARTAIASVVDGAPSVHTLMSCWSRKPELSPHVDFLGAMLSSYTFDFQIRMRMVGSHLSQFVMNDTAVISPDRAAPYADALSRLAFRLRARGPASAREWLSFGFDESRPWRSYWAVTRHERLRIRAILDAAIAWLYDLDEADLRWILRDCDYPLDSSTSDEFTRGLDPKGFWRVDRDQPPELRHPVLSLVAFRALQDAGGLGPFLALNDGDGWALPETLRLADHGLGQGDPRAQVPQPVAISDALTPQYRADQLDQDAAESWEECRRHARILEALWALDLGTPERGGPADVPPSAPVTPASAPAASEAPAPPSATQLPLFGRRQ